MSLNKQVTQEGKLYPFCGNKYSNFNEPIKESEDGNNQKELFMSLIIPSSYLLTGQRSSVNDTIDSQPINQTSTLCRDGHTGRSTKDFKKANLKLPVSEAVLKLYDDLEVERQVIGPVRRCLEVIHKQIMDDATKHDVRQSLAKCAGNTNDKLRCYQTVPTDFGEECWYLVRKTILKNITPA